MRKAIMMAAIAATAMTIGCSEARSQNGPAIQRAYPVSGFERIEVGGPYEVDVRTGATASVQASGSQADLERLVVEVRNGTLRIHPRKERGLKQRWSNRGKVHLRVSVPRLSHAAIAGSGGMRIDRVSGESFSGAVAGSGDLRIGTIDVGRLTVEVAGSGEVQAGGGRASQASYEIAGSGDINMGSLTSQSATVSIAGSGNVNAHATGTASVEIAGSGDVRLRGGAQCQVRKAGSGRVDCSS